MKDIPILSQLLQDTVKTDVIYHNVTKSASATGKDVSEIIQQFCLKSYQLTFVLMPEVLRTVLKGLRKVSQSEVNSAVNLIALENDFFEVKFWV